MSQADIITADRIPPIRDAALGRPVSWRTHLDFAGRLLLGGVSIAVGLLDLLDHNGTLTRVTAVGMAGAAPAAAVVGLVHALAGLALLLGWRTRLAAALLAALTVLGAPLFDRFWSAPGPFSAILLSSFLARLALAGALLSLAGRGPGRWSLDALRRD